MNRHVSFGEDVELGAMMLIMKAKTLPAASVRQGCVSDNTDLINRSGECTESWAR